MSGVGSSVGLRVARRLGLFGAGGSILLGGLVMAAWLSGHRRLLQVEFGLAPMQFNTALGFLLAGAGLLALVLGRPRSASLSGLVVGLLGTASLLQYVAGWDLGIDTLFVEPYVTTGTSHPGRMAPNTAVCFALAGVALVAAAGPWSRRRSLPVFGVAASLCGFIGLVSALGYFLRLPTAYSWAGLTQMAAHTSAGFVLLSVGLVAAALYSAESSNSGGRRWVAVALGLGIGLGALLLWRAIRVDERAKAQVLVATEVQKAGSQIEVELDERLSAVRRSARRWARRSPSEEEFALDAEALLEDFPALLQVSWLRPDGSLRRSVPEEAEGALASMCLATDGESGERTGVARSQGGRVEIWLCAPILSAQRLNGVLLARYSLTDLIDRLLLVDSGLDLGFELSIENQVVERRGGDPAPGGARSTLSLGLPGEGWQLEGWATRGLARSLHSPLSGIVLVVGWILAVSLSTSVLLAQNATARRREAEEARALLAREGIEKEQMQALLRDRNRDLETLLYITSHDLREPLRSIRAFSEIVLREQGDRLDAEGRDLLERVVRAGERLDRLIADILLLSRAQRKVTPNETVAGREIVDDVLAGLQDAIRSSGAKVTVEALPQLHVSRKWVTQALYNLVVNALKFTAEGKTPEVEIGSYEPGPGEPPGQGIVVRDRGPGVPPELVERIFVLFQRGVGREVEGTGAGLAIVRQVAERHGGGSWVNARPGGGSEFVLHLGGGAIGG